MRPPSVRAIVDAVLVSTVSASGTVSAEVNDRNILFPGGPSAVHSVSTLNGSRASRQSVSVKKMSYGTLQRQFSQKRVATGGSNERRVNSDCR
jgi:hypothetical protein